MTTYETALRPADDDIHPIGPEPSWREAFYFDFIDPETGLTGFGYSGVHPNQEAGDVIFALWKNDVLLAKFTRWDFNIPRDIGEERLDFGPLCFAPLRPFQSWEMHYDDGRCRLALTFEAIHRPYSWADSNTALSRTNSHHYEQQGRFTGTVQVAAHTYRVNAAGVRDHAWGWGARSGLRKWLWASAQFSRDFAFNVFQLTLEDGTDTHYGYVFRGGENIHLQQVRTVCRYASPVQSPVAFRVECTDQGGRELQAHAQVRNAFNISHQERNKQGYHFFCATEFDCGGLKGTGHSNFYWRKNRWRPADWTVRQT